MANDSLTKKILNKEVDRKQFLQFLGVAVGGVIGANTLISTLVDPNKSFGKSKSSVKSRSFNGGKYGY